MLLILIRQVLESYNDGFLTKTIIAVLDYGNRLKYSDFLPSLTDPIRLNIWVTTGSTSVQIYKRDKHCPQDEIGHESILIHINRCIAHGR